MEEWKRQADPRVHAVCLIVAAQVYDATEDAAQMLFKQAASAGERYLAHRCVRLRGWLLRRTSWADGRTSATCTAATCSIMATGHMCHPTIYHTMTVTSCHKESAGFDSTMLAAACRHGGEAADVASVAVGIITDLLNITINW